MLGRGSAYSIWRPASTHADGDDGPESLALAAGSLPACRYRSEGHTFSAPLGARGPLAWSQDARVAQAGVYFHYSLYDDTTKFHFDSFPGLNRAHRPVAKGTTQGLNPVSRRLLFPLLPISCACG